MYTNDIISENIEGKAAKYRRSKLSMSARDKQNIPVYAGTLHFFFNTMINKVAKFPNAPAMQRVVAIRNLVFCRIVSSRFFTGIVVDLYSELFNVLFM
jgi:hypothetical protein